MISSRQYAPNLRTTNNNPGNHTSSTMGDQLNGITQGQQATHDNDSLCFRQLAEGLGLSSQPLPNIDNPNSVIHDGGLPGLSGNQQRKLLYDQQQQQTNWNSLLGAHGVQEQNMGQDKFGTPMSSQQHLPQQNMAVQQGTAQQQQNQKYMFVATIVDPSKDESQPRQQMILLPGSNQIIPMYTNNSGLSPMMALTNLPVAFPQNQANQGGNRTEALSASSILGNSTTVDSQSLPIIANQWHSPHSAQFPEPNLALNAHTLQQSMNPLLNKIKHSGERASNSLPTASDISKTKMPVRPLSAYNFFFSDERDRILNGRTVDNWDNTKKQQLLLQHLAKDRTKRRPHRKTHGKINFTTLSKLIGQRWKELPDDKKNFYREVAAIDLDRYQGELREREAASRKHDNPSL